MSEIIFLNSSLNTVTFYKNVYANSSAFKVLKYDINLAFFVNQSTIIRIKLYKTFINNFFDKSNLIIKFITTNAHD